MLDENYIVDCKYTMNWILTYLIVFLGQMTLAFSLLIVAMV